MRISLADNRSFDINNFLPFALSHLLNGHSYAMWNLFIESMKCFFSDDLCHNLSLRLIGNCIFIIEHGAVGHIFEQGLDNVIRVLSTQCGHRNDFGEII